MDPTDPTPPPITPTTYVEIGPNLLKLGLAQLKLYGEIAMSKYAEVIKQAKDALEAEKAQGAALSADNATKAARIAELEAKLADEALTPEEVAELEAIRDGIKDVVVDATAAPAPDAPPVA